MRSAARRRGASGRNGGPCPEGWGRAIIGLYAADGITRLPVTYNAFDFHPTTGTAREGPEINAWESRTEVTQVIDQRNDDRDGSEIYRPRKPVRVIRQHGTIRAPTPAEFYDILNNMAEKVDPVLVRRANPTVEGFIALNFTTPREAGNLLCKYNARARGMPEPRVSIYEGTMQAIYTIDWLLRDPRRYLQTQSSLSGAGTATNSGNYPTWPEVTITMAGAGSATYSMDITGDSGVPLVLNLSALVNLDVVVVDHENRRILKNGTEMPSLYVSGDYYDLSAGANTVALANTTNATTVHRWYSAFAI